MALVSVVTDRREVIVFLDNLTKSVLREIDAGRSVRVVTQPGTFQAGDNDLLVTGYAWMIQIGELVCEKPVTVEAR